MQLLSNADVSQLGHIAEFRDAIRAFDAAQSAGVSAERLSGFKDDFHMGIESVTNGLAMGFDFRDTDGVEARLADMDRTARSFGLVLTDDEIIWFRRGVLAAIGFFRRNDPRTAKPKRRPAPPKGRPQLRVVGR